MRKLFKKCYQVRFTKDSKKLKTLSVAVGLLSAGRVSREYIFRFYYFLGKKMQAQSLVSNFTIDLYTS